MKWFKKNRSKYAPNYLTNLACSLRRLGQFTENKDLINFPFWGKKAKNIRATMTSGEIKRFLSVRPSHHIYEKYWKKWDMFFKIMAYTGMRCGEVAHLEKGDVDFDRLLFVLRETKTDSPRLVPIPDFLLDELRGFCKKTRTKLLFPTEKSRKPEHNVNWHYQFKMRIKLLKIKRKNLTPYSLRHSFITNKISKNINIFNLQAVVGHKNIKTTAQYVHLSVEGLRNVVNAK